MNKLLAGAVLAITLAVWAAFPALGKTSVPEVSYDGAIPTGFENKPVGKCVIDGLDYYRLRDMAYESGLFHVDYDEEDHSVIIYAGSSPMMEKPPVYGLTADAYVPSDHRMYVENKYNQLFLKHIILAAITTLAKRCSYL